MSELSELEAYKQLLQVTQNIMNELSPEQEILHKYLTLKKSILSKAKQSTSNSQILSNKILHSYKSITKNMLQCLTEFESQIESEMSKENFIKNANKFIKDIEKQCRNIGDEIGDSAGAKGIKVMLKEQINSIKFICKQFVGKVENMGLMIQVHRKMHEIILEASQKQAKTAHKQNQYNRRLGEMEGVVDQVNDIRKFIESYQLTDKKLRKFQMAKKNLAKVLFDL